MKNAGFKAKIFLIFSGLWLAFLSALQSQNAVIIGAEQGNRHAVLQLVSPDNNQGILLPQLYTADRNGMALSDQDNGMLVFDVDAGKFYYWNAGRWQEISQGMPPEIVAGEGIFIDGYTISNTGDLDNTNEWQVLSISNDTIFLSEGGYVKLPDQETIISFEDLIDVPANLDSDSTDDFDGDYSHLTGTPTNLSAFVNDVGYVTLPASADTSVTNEIQTVSRTGLTVNLSDGGGSYADSVNTLAAGTGIDITGKIISRDETPLAIGDNYGGGVIFWLDESGEHGLIVAPEDQGTDISWAPTGYFTVYVSARRNGVGAGAFNTERIIAGIGQGDYAAWLCSYYQGGSYGDWYLPAREELQVLAQSSVGSTFPANIYWSSNEASTTNAYAIHLPDGVTIIGPKNLRHYIRAIRSF